MMPLMRCSAKAEMLVHRADFNVRNGGNWTLG